MTLVSLAVMAAPLAMAQDSVWYMGANAGTTRATIDDTRIISGLQGAGFGSATVQDDDSDAGFKVFGGYQLNKNIAVEGGYFDLGKFGYSATTVPPGRLNGEIRLRGFNLDLVGKLPITDKFSVLGRIGANYAEARDTFSGTGAVRVLNPNPSKYDTNAKLGLGLQYDFTDAWSMRAEIERYRINDAVGNRGDVDHISVGLVYRFGAKERPMQLASAAPAEPVYVAPVVIPIIVTPPPPAPLPAPALRPLPVPVKTSYSADALFGFDKAVVSTEGKQDLDKLAQDLQGLDYAVVRITGHTDRIGSHDYNMKLSTRRAESVQSYLVNTAGVPASKIEARGVDGADPVTKPGDCVGKKATPKLIACLQPDRRVDIEVSGTR